MALFEGRILITDCSNKDDRDAVVGNILNHKSSRAILYLMVKDFKEIPSIRQEFPTVVPFVFIPGENVDRTRRILKLLPHMDHFVNFLGHNLALEFLNNRKEFRIKPVSNAYARSKVIDKILSSNQQGIIFNVNTSDNHFDNVVTAGSSATKSIKDSVKRVIFGSAGPSSIEERKPLISKENNTQNSEPALIDGTPNVSSSIMSNVWRFIVSLYYFVCPCINDARVIIPVTEYPKDLDTKLVEAFHDLYTSLEADWFQKLEDARQSKENAIKQVQNTKEERVEKEYNRLIGTNSDLTSIASNRLQAFVNVRNYIRLEKDKIKQEFDRKTDLLYFQHYHVIVEEQFEMLITFWKKMRLRP